jgi:hypothetical protein
MHSFYYCPTASLTLGRAPLPQASAARPGGLLDDGYASRSLLQTTPGYTPFQNQGNRWYDNPGSYSSFPRATFGAPLFNAPGLVNKTCAPFYRAGVLNSNAQPYSGTGAYVVASCTVTVPPSPFGSTLFFGTQANQGGYAGMVGARNIGNVVLLLTRPGGGNPVAAASEQNNYYEYSGFITGVQLPPAPAANANINAYLINTYLIQARGGAACVALARRTVLTKLTRAPLHHAGGLQQSRVLVRRHGRLVHHRQPGAAAAAQPAAPVAAAQPTAAAAGGPHGVVRGVRLRRGRLGLVRQHQRA